MIIDDASVKKYGNVPTFVMEIANKAATHGRLFSQDPSCLFVFYHENKKGLKGWMIIDNYNRHVYDSIFFANNETAYVSRVADRSHGLYEYKSNDCLQVHASQFFMPEITNNLIKEKAFQEETL
tara:strand:- start:986 stop:1357 length:372 start_codon:yes stop_codon:yes gene_type:complete